MNSQSLGGSGVDGASVEESFEDLYENAPCGYLTATMDGVVVRANATFCGLIGRRKDEVIGASIESMLRVGSRLFFQTRYLPTLRLSGEVREVVFELSGSDGRVLPILVNSVLIERPGAAAPLVRSAVFDATVRRNYERELLESRRAAEGSEARVRVLQEASASFGAAETEEALGAALVEITRRAFDAGSVAVLLTQGSGPLQLAAGGRPLGSTVALIAGEPEAEAIRLVDTVTVSSADHAERDYPAIADRLRETRLEAISVVPILVDEAPVGVLACYFGRQRTFGDDELALQSGIARLAAQVLQRIRLQGQLQHQALHDQLTGLANRALLQTRLAQVLEASARYSRPMAVIFLDLDGFKRINDKLGHGIGDVALKQIANGLRRVVRTGDTIARFGGDEFVVVCEDADDNGALHAAERIRQAVELPLHGVPTAFALTASIGVAVYLPREGYRATVEDLLRAADAAQYESKHGGKDRVTVVRV
jgi:diguanylate cyclase (GGDEF)-like protein/PAS domain S-box-containing protein